MRSNLFYAIKDCDDVADVLRSCKAWMLYVLTEAQHSFHGCEIAVSSHRTTKLLHTSLTVDKSTTQLFHSDGVLALAEAMEYAAAQMDEAMGKMENNRNLNRSEKPNEKETTASEANNANTTIKQILKQGEIDAATRFAANMQKLIDQYIDVMDALGWVGHDKELIINELYSDGETHQLGKTHNDVVGKIKKLHALEKRDNNSNLSDIAQVAIKTAHDDIQQLLQELQKTKDALNEEKRNTESYKQQMESALASRDLAIQDLQEYQKNQESKEKRTIETQQQLIDALINFIRVQQR